MIEIVPQKQFSLPTAATFPRVLLLLLMMLFVGIFLFGNQRVAAQKGDKDDPKKELNVLVDEDFKKLKLGALPKGWAGDFSAIDDGGDIRCLACDKQTGFHYLKLPRVNLKGDFVIECEFIVFDSGFGPQHQLGIQLENTRGEKIALSVTGLGNVHLHQNQPRPTAGFQRNQKARVRFAHEDGIFSVQVNGKDVTGGKIADPAGPFTTVHIGLLAGTIANNTAKLYSVKVSSEGKASLPPVGTNIDDDFRDTKVGNLPKAWTSGAGKIGAQVAGERRRLELVNQGISADFVEVPGIALKKNFFAECNFLMFDRKTSLLLHISSDGKQQIMNVMTNGEGQIFLQTLAGVTKYDVSKTLNVQGQENLLRLERKDAEYVLKLNGTLVGSAPTNIVMGPFNMVRLGLKVAEEKHRSPAITRVRVRALDNIED